MQRLHNPGPDMEEYGPAEKAVRAASLEGNPEKLSGALGNEASPSDYLLCTYFSITPLSATRALREFICCRFSFELFSPFSRLVITHSSWERSDNPVVNPGTCALSVQLLSLWFAHPSLLLVSAWSTAPLLFSLRPSDSLLCPEPTASSLHLHCHSITLANRRLSLPLLRSLSLFLLLCIVSHISTTSLSSSPLLSLLLSSH